jgi:two-component system OmpR family sensor kinase
MSSLRRTALVWTTVLLAFVGVVAVSIAYALARREAGTFLDSQLRQIALNVGDGLPETAGPPVDHDPEDEFSVAIFDRQGEVVRRAPPDIDIPLQETVGFSNIASGGDVWRVYTSSDGVRTIQVAQRMSVREELAADAAVDAAMPILVVIPLSWIVIGWAMNQLLGRLNALASRIASDSAHTDVLVPLAGVPQEVAPLIQAMNSLIARLRAALLQQRQFVSDAAHELRTPLAALQVQVDGLASAERSVLPERQAALAQGVRRAAALVEQLLRLARLEEPGPALAVEPVAIIPILLSSIADQVAIAERRGVDVGVLKLEPFLVDGTADDLRVLFGNLLENAVRYTQCGGTVDVSAQLLETGGVVEIIDSGPGIPAGAADRIFDRFFRAAPADSEGTGLGLAIVRRIAERHDYAVSVTNRTDGRRGVAARITFAGAKMLAEDTAGARTFEEGVEYGHVSNT